jgi:hypothetical protein
MNDQPRRSIAELFADDAVMNAAVEQAAREAVLKHAQAGQAVPTWRDGKVVWIPAEEMLARLSGSHESASHPRRHDAV